MSRFAICVGHSRRGDRGAINTKGISEHAFNLPLAERVCELLEAAGHSCKIFSSYDADRYEDAMRWVAKEIGAWRADAAVELHFNSASPSAEGYEYLFWGRSQRAENLAQCFALTQKKAFPQCRFRGLKPCDNLSRGAAFLRRTPCPAVILEPFFGSNPQETDLYSASLEQLARVYADALCLWASNKS